MKTCLECGILLKSITNTHLRGHNLTIKEYQNKYNIDYTQIYSEDCLSKRILSMKTMQYKECRSKIMNRIAKEGKIWTQTDEGKNSISKKITQAWNDGKFDNRNNITITQDHRSKLIAGLQKDIVKNPNKFQERIKKLQYGREKWQKDNPVEVINRIKIMNKARKPCGTNIEVQVINYIKTYNEIKYLTQVETNIQKRIYLLDIVIPSLNLAIEINGCYWHGCLQCFPTSKIDYKVQELHSKFRQNDIVKYKDLTTIGLKLLIICEHDVKSGKYKEIIDNTLKGIKVE